MRNIRKTMVALIAAFIVFGLAACGSTPDGKAIDAAHNSRNSVNWDGVYTGTIPAADGEGINVQITLNLDETYKIQYEYIGKSANMFIEDGSFKWDENGDSITLDSQDLPPYYKVGENTLIQLDATTREVITGELADNYVLRKTP